MERKRRVLLSKSVVIGAAVPVLMYAYSGGPPAARTGAPGESTCMEYHGGGKDGGYVEIGFPGGMVYAPGVKQRLTVVVTDADAQWYGFELGARVAADNSQAGTLPQTTQRGQLKTYVTVNAANGNGDPGGNDIYTANYTLTSQLGQPAGGPSFTSAAILNGASFTAGMAPGAFITIFGQNLAPRTRTWDDAIQGTALPAQLEGVSVTVDGKPAYLSLVSPAQLNVLLPTDDMMGSVEVKVTTPQGSSSVTALMQRYALGFFANSLDRKSVVATHADNVLVAKVGQVPGVTTRPAQPGEEILLWGTGFGPTAPQAPSGQVLTKAYPLADLRDLKVTIGGRDGRVTFAGVTFAGLYQINVVVPADLTDGDQAVLAEIGGTRTQDNSYIAVQRRPPAVPSSILVSYRLDPWLISGNYGEGFWVSPPVFGPVTQGGSTFVLETRALGLDAQGQLLDMTPQWIPADPGMFTVSPSQGKQVTITVQRAGQSSLKVTSQGVSKELAIKAAYKGDVMLVEIAQ